MSRTAREEREFQARCRKPGTRMNEIFTLIEQGWSDEDIAALYDVHKPASGAHTCVPHDIALYRKVLSGDTARIGQYEVEPTRRDHRQRDARICMMRAAGWKVCEISAYYGLERNRVFDIIKRNRQR